ncbi:NAD(P)/FAD-dependent oxidoreductase [Acuticoccus sp. M5D2P5]|uniref:FAD/NAD(P)-dependent oxidoreductase n=1 Tax=Acuticoccus kalidii TaxID=2910977 RepID=UPI001F28B5B4|nr:NAD(P)/FAD-dependent oxidoreductase [Acuticoccus kalidii]MCF3935203.1 NAD(P)/FAD-dependent oxidoreductase [Acuticoccus kalidii]
MTRYDLVVIGAGPAGMAAAIEADKAGLSVLVLDEAPAPGGQIYRAVEATDAARRTILGADYAHGAELAKAFRASGATYRAGASVWNVSPEKVVDYSTGDGSRQVEAGAIIIATGAVERSTPMKGWLLPGVTTAGAMQILLKAHGVVEPDTVFVGSGPLLWLIASQMIAAGAKPKAIVETVPRGRLLAAAKHLPKALKAQNYLAKGFQMMKAVRKAGVPVHRYGEDIVIEGTNHVEAVTFTADGERQRIETRHVALHQGVVPNQQITRLLNCEHRYDTVQRAFAPVLSEDGETTLKGVYVAGDGGGISGARAAALTGRLAAMAAATAAGRSVDGAMVASVRAALGKDRAIRPLLDTLYAPSPEALAPADDVVVCRCEEVTAGDIRAAAKLGAPGPNQVKSYLRAGMGPCQGRVCGLVVAEIMAVTRGESLDAIGYYRIRPPLKPLPLAELAALDEPIAAE